MKDQDGKQLEVGDTVVYWELPNPYGFRMSSIIVAFEDDNIVVQSGARWPLKDVRFLWRKPAA
ncbi:MAG: hypothetical protein KJ077_07715 [Anaerolineae bacterium]|nr:hypothetical protein [Anaerolineae bacterium]